MLAFSVRELKNNPSAALRAARERPVVVLSRNTPEALLVHLDDDTILAAPGVRRALALALFGEGCLSLGHAARFSGMATAEFIEAASRLGNPGGPGHAGERGRGGPCDRCLAERLVTIDPSALTGYPTITFQPSSALAIRSRSTGTNRSTCKRKTGSADTHMWSPRSRPPLT